MSVVQYKKYFWLVDTIRSAGKITKEQIDRFIQALVKAEPTKRPLAR